MPTPYANQLINEQMPGQNGKQSRYMSSGDQGMPKYDKLQYVSRSTHLGYNTSEQKYGSDAYPFLGYAQAPKTTNPIDPALYQQYLQTAYLLSGEMAPNIVPNSGDLLAWPTNATFMPADGGTFTNWHPLHTRFDSYELIAKDKLHVANSSQLPALGFPSGPEQLIAPSSGLKFNDFPTAMAAIPSRHWHPPTPDSSIPTTDLERQEWVLKLLYAINNTTNVLDAASRNFTKRWTTTPQYYSDTAKELIAWNIISLAESLHVNGPSSLLSFDTVFWRNATKSRTWTFKERMEKIVELLTYSMARCEKLLAGLGMQMVVANPDVVLRMTKGNGKQNGKRQALLEAGRAGKKLKTQSETNVLMM